MRQDPNGLERAGWESHRQHPVSWGISAAITVTFVNVVFGSGWPVAIAFGVLCGLLMWAFGRSRFVSERIRHLRDQSK